MRRKSLPDSTYTYFFSVGQLLGALDVGVLAQIIDTLWRAWHDDRSILVIGNGGSAATASHLAWDLIRQTEVRHRSCLRARSLADNLPAITAISNDRDFSRVFAHQLRALARPNDILICFSCSGESANVLEAIVEARRIGVRVISIGGRAGGRMRERSDIYLHVPSEDYGKIESVHLAIAHCLTSVLRERALTSERAVFVDRDGVIIRNRADYVKSCEEVEFIPGAIEALARLSQEGYRVIVVTNQSAVARGLIPIAELNRVHDLLGEAVRTRGGQIESFLVCPHLPEDACNCRKPRPGLLLRAEAELGIQLDTSFLIGDHVSDIQAANAVRSRGILVLSGRTRSISALHGPVPVVNDLGSAAEIILGECAASIEG